MKTQKKFQKFIAEIIIIAISLSTFYSVDFVLAAPPASPYTPGETLNPTCAPGDTNCTVAGNTAEYFTATSTTATSTFAAGIQTTALSITSSTASSTFANGIHLSGGCFAVAGVCLSSGSGTVNSGTVGQFAYYAANGTALTGTSSLFIATSGNVGIGTTSPYAKLSVQGGNGGAFTDAPVAFAVYGGVGGQTLTTGLQGGNIVLQGGAGGVEEMGGPGGDIYIAGGVGGKAQAGSDGRDGYTLLAITSSGVSRGNVGIGTTDPVTKLDIVFSNNTGLRLSDQTANTTAKDAFIQGRHYTSTEEDIMLLWSASNSGTNSIYFGGGSALYNTATDIRFFTAANSTTLTGTERMRIDSSGNVGIGTTSPYAKLSVVGQIVGAYFTGTTTATSTLAGGLQTALLNVTGTATSTFAQGINLSAGCFAVSGSCIGGGGSSQWTTSGSNIYYTTGNVGIGTTSPFAELSVQGSTDEAYALAVYGGAGSDGAGGGLPGNAAGGVLLIGGTGGMSTGSLGGLGGILNLFGGTGGTASAGTGGTGGAVNIIAGTGGTGSSATAGNGGNVYISGGTPGPGSAPGVGGNVFLGINASSTIYSSINIGTTTSPYARLSVWATSTQNIFQAVTTASSTAFIVTSGGSVGVGSTTPWKNFSVNGTVAFSGLTSLATGNAVCITTAKEITDAGGGTCTPSSERFKENIVDLGQGSALESLTKMRVVTFDYKEGYTSLEEASTSIGMIAEELEKIDTRLVDYGYDGKPLTIHFERVTALTVRGIQDLSSLLGVQVSTSTENMIRSTRLDDIESRLTALEEQINAGGLVSNINNWVGNSITAAIGIFKKIKVEDGIEMKDKSTGDIYCVIVDGGELKNLPGECMSSESTQEASPARSSEPESEVEITPVDFTSSPQVEPTETTPIESATSTPAVTETPVEPAVKEEEPAPEPVVESAAEEPITESSPVEEPVAEPVTEPPSDPAQISEPVVPISE